MTAQLPYMLSPGLIPKILGKIQEARRPERFTQDFLETKLGYSGGSARAIIPLLKRIGFLNSDGSPTDRYDQFRNENSQGIAMANALREGYKEIFDRNEYAGDLDKGKLQSLIVEITGAEKDSRVVQAIVSTFFALKEYADFDAKNSYEPIPHEQADEAAHKSVTLNDHIKGVENVGMNLSYTINLNLPETTNPEVFNAIFKSLRENLLRG